MGGGGATAAAGLAAAAVADAFVTELWRMFLASSSVGRNRIWLTRIMSLVEALW